MTTAAIARVARLHLVDRFSDTWLVWGILALTFGLNLAIRAVIPAQPEEGFFTGDLVTVYISWPSSACRPPRSSSRSR